MLQSAAELVARSTLYRHLMFAIATAFAIIVVGYHFGTFDQAIHLPFLKTFANPTLYPNDPFLALRYAHYSYFWFLFQPFYRAGILEPSMFVTHVLATYGTFWALWNLSEILFHNPIASFLAIIAFAFPHMTFGGWTVFEFSLLNRTFVLPFLLFAIYLFLQSRYLSAFALTGFVFNFHIIFANFVLAMFLWHVLLTWREIGWENIVYGILLFCVFALPVLIWKAQGAPIDFTMRRDALYIIAMSQQYNNYYLFAPYVQIIIATASGVGAFVLYFIARHYVESKHNRVLSNFIFAILIILTLGFASAQWFPIAIISELQLVRAAVFALIFGILCFAGYLAKLYTRRPSFEWKALTITFIASLFPIVPATVWLFNRVLRTRSQRWIVAVTGMLLSTSGFVVAGELGVWYPGIYVYAHTTPWYETQIWARDHTPKDAIFITPPQMWSLYEPDWRTFSERATVAQLSDLLEAALALQYVDVWTPRFEALAPGATAQFKGNFFDNPNITSRAFESLGTDDIMRIARLYNVSYLVTEKPHTYHFVPVYENQQFIIYQLPITPSN